MSSNPRRDESPALRRAKQEFEKWRQVRQVHERIPAALWALAVEAAKEQGFSKTSVALRLNYLALRAAARKRAGASKGADESPVAFVELPLPAIPGDSECLLEAENGRGTKLRIHLKGATSVDLTSLAGMLWRLER